MIGGSIGEGAVTVQQRCSDGNISRHYRCAGFADSAEMAMLARAFISSRLDQNLSRHLSWVGTLGIIG